jgi:hypothetical protein
VPSYSKDDKLFLITYITGPAHVLLGLAVTTGAYAGQIAMVRRSPVGHCGCGPVDEEEVRRAVLAGVDEANRKLATDFHPTEIVYDEGDTPRYSLYRHCAKLLIERINGGWT